MGSPLSLPSSQRVTLPKLTKERFRDEFCLTGKLFTFLMFLPTPNTPMAEARKPEHIVPFLAPHSCEKERQLALLPYLETRCGHSPTSKLSYVLPSPTRP